MEYQGIITGIGNKESGQNLIKPKYDAVINDFIIGKNTILEGLVLNGKNLSAGTCILCGYRGIINTPNELDTTAYVYGEFTLNFDTEIEDSFNIVTSTTALTKNVNPTEITSAGTYYLLLYENGNKQVDIINGKQVGEYPLNSYYSVETKNVLSGATISPMATTPTETKTITNELGEEETVVATDLHLTHPNRVANTEYVHAQIEKEVDYEQHKIDITATFTGVSSPVTIGTILLERKAKFCIGHISFDLTNVTPAMLSPDYNPKINWGKVGSKFIPNNSVGWWLSIASKATAVLVSKDFYLTIDSNGNITEKNSYYNGSISQDAYCWEYDIGYQCQ